MLLFNAVAGVMHIERDHSNTSHVIIQSYHPILLIKSRAFKYISCYYSMFLECFYGQRCGKFKYISCYYSMGVFFLCLGCKSIIQIHLMLLFNYVVETMNGHFANSNTSHVIIQCWHGWKRRMQDEIQIHLMLLFNADGSIVIDTKIKFKYISCYYSMEIARYKNDICRWIQIHLMLLFNRRAISI